MLLAIDTATRTVSLALLADHEIVAESSWRTAENHTVKLAPAFDALLRRRGGLDGGLLLPGKV
jgi:tRNA A37 threonylcarbamoyladenosine modification protein TsaB